MFQKLISTYKRFQVGSSPQMNLVWGFFLYTIVGWILLSLPIFHKTEISFIDNLFISTSAISTTGLVTIGIADSYTLFGQIIIMALFQVGGIGYMTLTTYFLLFTTKKISRWHKKIIGTAFTMPKSIRIKDFMKSVILFTIIMEILGSICFFIAFKQNHMDTGKAIWYAIFHSVSAFCTAGFGLFSDSFVGYQDNYFVNLVISILAISGSLGFIVITDIWYRIRKRSDGLTFTTKIVVVGFLILLTIGSLMVFLAEPTISQGQGNPYLQAFFQSMTAMTTVGFNTVDTGALSLPILLLVTFLMYVGASPSGTAGGMKITTLTAMIAILKSRLVGDRKINFINRKIPFERLYVATSTFILYTSLIFIFTFILSFSENNTLDRILFEVASALGTVGLSTGITGSLSDFGKAMIIILMFIGRVGVLTFGFALLERRKEEMEVNIPIEDDLAV